MFTNKDLFAPMMDTTTFIIKAVFVIVWLPVLIVVHIQRSSIFAYVAAGFAVAIGFLIFAGFLSRGFTICKGT